MSDALELLAAHRPPGWGERPPAPGYVVLDVFAERALEGNPLAVVLDGRGLGDERMQRLAREFNLSETVFFVPAEGAGDVRIRIFTPSRELPFAGHPTLGAAVVACTALGRDRVVLETAAAEVEVDVRAGAGGAPPFGRMRQPVPSWEAFERAEELLAVLGVERSELPVEVYDNGPRHVVVVLGGEDAVAALAPDLRALAALGELGIACVAGGAGRWRSRNFAPALGVGEDPATGSAAGPLAVHLARHGRIGFGREIEILQGVELGRPSRLYALAEGSPAGIERVEVAGSAVTVAAGTLLA